MRVAISERLNENGLTLKQNWQVYRYDKEPLDMMGFRFYRDRTTLRKSIMLAITRHVRKAWRAGEKVSFHLASAVLSYLGWIKHSDSYHLFERWIKPFLDIRTIKNAIRRHQYESLRQPVYC